MNAQSKDVTFTPLGQSAPARANETILDVAQRLAVPLANTCGAVGVCARCRVRVLAGADQISEPTSIEIRFARVHKFAEDERMACQAVVFGDCEVTTTYW